MVKRVVSGAVLLIIALVMILSGGPALAATLLALSLIAFMELSKASGVHSEGKGFNGLEIAGLLGITAYYLILAFAGEKEPLFLAAEALVFLMVLMAVYVFTFPRFKAWQVMACFFSFVYAPVLLSCVYLTRQREHGIYLVFMIFISSWVCDTCAYFTGVTLGRHKLSPKLSPKKSVEGAVGGVAGSALAGAAFAYFVVGANMGGKNLVLAFALVSAAGACISQIGDLAASGIKRDHEIKDYGKLIPGHGGIMDRFDSVIFTAPVIYLMTALFVNV